MGGRGGNQVNGARDRRCSEADGDREESLTESGTQQQRMDASAKAKNMGPNSDVQRRDRHDE